MVLDCRSVHRRRTIHKWKKLQLAKYLDVIGQKVSHVDNSQPYVSSPFTLPPFDSLPPVTAPPYCSYPPYTQNTPPQPPSSPFAYISSSPPPPPFYYLPPLLPSQSPPPTPTYGGFTPSPPDYYEPSPPSYAVPTPPVFEPSPPVFQPPVIYPPPSVPPPPHKAPNIALWCVAKPTVPDPIIQEAMNYACGTVADCDSILPSGACYMPNTALAHASYAFNSYWQRTKVGGGTCEFGGTAMLVTVDPSNFLTFPPFSFSNYYSKMHQTHSKFYF